MRPETDMSHEEIKDLLPSYALGALGADESEILVRHLPTCDSCPGELAEYQQAVGIFPGLMPQATPSPKVKERLMALLSPPPGSAFSWRRFALAWTPLSLLLLAGVLAVSFSLSNQLQTQQEAMATVLNLEGTEIAPQAQGIIFFVPQQRMAMLAVRGLPAPPPGWEYQLWLIRDSERHSGGTFVVDSQGRGYLFVQMPQDIASFPTAGITMEPEGGSLAPSGDRYMLGSI
ncbi:MAG: anti-sigma factor [Chloroflexi bacterium]|nr:anti-sigma factor [Chloroflexota bacterium]